METSEKIEVEESKIGYGGWLRFFRIINAIYWISGGLVIVGLGALMLFTWGESPQEDWDILSGVIEVIPGTIMSFLIWKVVLVQSIETPPQLKQLLQVELALHFIVTAFIYYAYKQGYISDGPVPILVSIVYYFIWSTYLKKSKRVKSFYGKNSANPS